MAAAGTVSFGLPSRRSTSYLAPAGKRNLMIGPGSRCRFHRPERVGLRSYTRQRMHRCQRGSRRGSELNPGGSRLRSPGWSTTSSHCTAFQAMWRRLRGLGLLNRATSPAHRGASHRRGGSFFRPPRSRGAGAPDDRRRRRPDRGLRGVAAPTVSLPTGSASICPVAQFGPLNYGFDVGLSMHFG